MQNGFARFSVSIPKSKSGMREVEMFAWTKWMVSCSLAVPIFRRNFCARKFSIIRCWTNKSTRNATAGNLRPREKRSRAGCRSSPFARGFSSGIQCRPWRHIEARYQRPQFARATRSRHSTTAPFTPRITPLFKSEQCASPGNRSVRRGFGS